MNSLVMTFTYCFSGAAFAFANAVAFENLQPLSSW